MQPPAANTSSPRKATQSEPSLAATDVGKEFDNGVAALAGITLDTRPGEFVSIVGPSGCGKSTFLRLAAGLTPLTSGDISIYGTPVDAPRRDVGLMFQRPTLLPWRTALENVLLPGELRARKAAGRVGEAYELLTMVGLGGFEHAYPRHLSGGMQQRVALARLLLLGVDVLLLDEPFGAVDALTRDRLNLELLRIHDRLSPTILLVTHSLAESVLLADRVIVMSPRPGRIAGVVDVPFERPRDLSVAGEPTYQDLVAEARSALENADDGAAAS